MARWHLNMEWDLLTLSIDERNRFLASTHAELIYQAVLLPLKEDGIAQTHRWGAIMNGLTGKQAIAAYDRVMAALLELDLDFDVVVTLELAELFRVEALGHVKRGDRLEPPLEKLRGDLVADLKQWAA